MCHINTMLIVSSFPLNWKPSGRPNGARVREQQPPSVWSKVKSKYTCHCKVAKPNLFCLIRPIDFATAYNTFIPLWAQRGGRTANVAEKNKAWLCPLARLWSHFPSPVGVFRQEKERRRKGGKNHWVAFRKLSGYLDPAGLKGRKRGALSLGDKWTSSIDCKV